MQARFSADGAEHRRIARAASAFPQRQSSWDSVTHMATDPASAWTTAQRGALRAQSASVRHAVNALDGKHMATDGAQICEQDAQGPPRPPHSAAAGFGPPPRSALCTLVTIEGPLSSPAPVPAPDTPPSVPASPPRPDAPPSPPATPLLDTPPALDTPPSVPASPPRPDAPAAASLPAAPLATCIEVGRITPLPPAAATPNRTSLVPLHATATHPSAMAHDARRGSISMGNNVSPQSPAPNRILSSPAVGHRRA